MKIHANAEIVHLDLERTICSRTSAPRGDVVIVVCAAGGRIGRRVLDLLASSGMGNQVIATARKKPEGLNANFRASDYDDVDSLEKAFQGAERVLFIPSFADTDERAQQGRNVVEAAERAGVSQIIFIGLMDNRMDSPMPFARAYGEIEEAMTNSSVPGVIIRTSMYTDNLAEQYPVWLKTGKLVTCAGDGAVSYVSRDDIAASIVGILKDPVNVHNGRIYTLTGPEALRYVDVASIINELFGAEIEIIDVEREEFASRLKEIWGVAYGGIEHVARVTPFFQAVFKQGIMGGLTSDVETLTGSPPETARSWLERHM